MHFLKFSFCLTSFVSFTSAMNNILLPSTFLINNSNSNTQCKYMETILEEVSESSSKDDMPSTSKIILESSTKSLSPDQIKCYNSSIF